MLEEFKGLVPREIYHRGEAYYNEGRVIDYRLIPLKNDKYQINATVVGETTYSVEIQLSFRKNFFKYKGFCSCPYKWSEVCKHQVAAMLYFFERNYPKIINQEDSVNFERLLEIMEKPSLEPIALEFQIKGLLSPRMVNFSLSFSSPNLTEREIEGITDYIRDGEMDYPLSGYNVQTPIDEGSLQVIQFLRNARTRASRSSGTILLPKTPGNFAFIYNLTKHTELICQELGTRIQAGQTLQPALSITGTEDRVSFHLSAEDFEIFSNEDELAPVWWTVIDEWLHPLNLQELESLPKKVEIPEEMKGKFLFEILPEFQRRYDAKLGSQLQGYELNRIYPEIYVSFDYQDGEIICDTLVKIEEREVTGIDTLDLAFEEGHYRRSLENPQLWYGVDRESLRDYILFLEENEFIISKGRFMIKEKEDIQNFITGGFLHLPEDWHVTTSKEFDHLEVVPIELIPVVDVSTDGQIDWFDFQITYNLGGQTFTHQEILSMLRKNSQGESFIQIDNKYFVIYNDEKRRIIDETIPLARQGQKSYQSQFYNLLFYRNLFENNGIKINGDRIYNELQEDITGEKIVQEMEIPIEVQGVLRNYQKTGYYWMGFLHKYRFGGILADDMGLGKTIQVLTLLRGLNTRKPSLVVCPTTLLYNWAAEIEKFFPNMRYLVYYGTPTERQELGEKIEEYEIIITTYAIVGRDLDILQDKSFAYCILDEAQLIKNFRTKRAESVKNIRADHRLVLTGTPIENSLDELWSIFDFLMGGYLGTYTGFKKKYVTPIKEKNEQKLLTELKQRVSPFILRRNKSEVLLELPEKTELVTKVKMTKLQEDVYQTILDQVKRDVIISIQEYGFNRSHITVLAALTRLRQICNHPQLVLHDIDEKVTSGKIDALMEIVGEAVAGNHKLLIFSQFVKMLRIIEEEFKREGFTYEYLDGSTKNRMERVTRFNESPEINAFLISLKAGGTGLNLTSADIVIHVDPWWNPMVENQATDRAHRIGQENKVLVYKLITDGTVEEKMLKLQQRKRNIFDAVIEQNAEVVEQLTWEDVQELFGME